MIEIIDQFSVQGAIKSYERLERGHINDTFKVVTTDQEYLFQKINHKIFKDVSGMMRNIQRITDHLPAAYDRLGITSQEALQLIQTHRLENYVHHEEGYFRMFDFKSHLKSLDVPESEEQIFEGAKSYGFFLRALNDFNPSDLSVTLADFHNLDYRIRNFKEAKAKIKNVKSHSAADQIAMVTLLTQQLLPVWSLDSLSLVRKRVTHNDTKFNNVLLNQLNKGCCVIDLDTVMPGIVHYDFGDGIRSTACTAAEDESDLQWVSLDRNRFFAFKEGYLEGAKDELDATEIQFLPLSGAYMAFIMGLRFLTDYMEGNTYYKIDHPNHNLDRCKNQFKLSQDILHQLNDLK
jgi:thiamine kinase-like enzyme